MVRALIRTGFLFLLAGLLVLPAIAGAGSGDRLGTIQGKLVELHRDVVGGEPIPGFGLSRAGGLQSLSADQPRALLGQKVTVDDTSNRAGLQGEAQATSATRELLAAAPGPQSTAVVLVNFNAPNDTTPVSAADLQATIFTAPNSVSRFFQQQSDDQVELIGLNEDDDNDQVADDGTFDGVDHNGDVFGWWTLNMAKPTCSDAALDTEMNAIITKARAYDGTVGVNLDNYEHVTFYFPTNDGCDWAGLGMLPGRYSWINGANDTRVIAHELGHNMGVHHAASLNCGSRTITADPYSVAAQARTDGCQYSEYGDNSDVMGSSTALMSAWHRAQLGQLPDAAQTTATTSGSYTLDAVNNRNADDPRLLLVPRRVGSAPVTSYFALELRSSFGQFDTGSSLFLAQRTGVTIRLVPTLANAEQSELLDTHPAINPNFVASALQPGETFTDPLSGVVIRNDATAGGTANLTVTVAELDTTPPTAPVVTAVAGAHPELTWTAASDNVGVDHYEVRRNGVAIAQTPATTLSYTDSGVRGLAQAEYRVVAFDAAANSAASEPVSVDLPDTTAPVMVAASAERRANGDVALTFSGTDDRSVDHYSVSWVSGSAIVSGNQWQHTGAPAAATSYLVRAVDVAGNASNAMTVAVGPAPTSDDAGAAPTSPTALAPLPRPRLLLTRGRAGRIMLNVPGASRITVAGAGWRAAVAGARFTRTLPVKVRKARRVTLEVRAVVAGTTLRATLVVRRGVVDVR